MSSPPPLRAGLRVALNRPRVFALVALAVAAELSFRLLAGFAHPVLSVLVPPVVAVMVLGAQLPAVRTVASDSGAVPEWRLRSRVRTAGPRLAVVATVGHAGALAFGTALFLLVDTPVRFALYALGRGPLPWPVVYLAPLVGVASASLVGWALLAPAVARVADGGTVSSALATATAVAVTEPQRTASVLAAHALCVLAIALAVGTGLVSVGGLVLRSPAEFLVVAGLGALVGTLALAFLYPVHAALAAATPAVSRLPARRVALVGLLVGALVVGAAGVRVTETRPVPETEPLPADPTRAYATAISNTASLDHEVTYRQFGGRDPLFVTRSVDRSNRRYQFASTTLSPLYADGGVGYPATPGFDRIRPFTLGKRHVEGGTATALPAYWLVARDTAGGELALPDPGVGAWSVVDRGDERLLLELTGDAAVVATVGAGGRDRYSAASVRIRIDTGRGVVVGGSGRLNRTDAGPVRLRYAVQTGDDVAADRPAALGAPTAGELLWKLFAY